MNIFDTTYRAYTYRRRIGGTLLSILIVFGFLYGIFVKQTVSHIVERQQYISEKAALATELAFLEESYLKKTHVLTKDLAYSLGLVEALQVYYTLRGGTQTTLTVRTE
jgi:F0F1-type ATP synthase membrane subunit b/b'